MDLKGKRILVFCSSSPRVAEAYQEAAAEVGESVGREGCELVFGGTDTGLMGILARSAQKAGARVTGIIPEKMHTKGLGYAGCNDLVVCRDLHERKARMQAASDVIICLPGGFGSLDELAESLALKQLKYEAKPVVLINTIGYFDPLLGFFERMILESFARPEYRSFYFAAADAEDAFSFLKNYGGSGA